MATRSGQGTKRGSRSQHWEDPQHDAKSDAKRDFLRGDSLPQQIEDWAHQASGEEPFAHAAFSRNNADAGSRGRKPKSCGSTQSDLMILPPTMMSTNYRS